MKSFYSRDNKKKQEEKLKQEKERTEQDMVKYKAQYPKLKIEIVPKDHSKVIEAQQRLKALQKEESKRFNRKDKREAYLNLLENERSAKGEKSSNIQALDLQINIESKIPRPTKKIAIQPIQESKIPKIFKSPLPEIPEKFNNLPWKRGDLLDSLDLGSTNLKKLFQNRPKFCDSPGSKAVLDPNSLKENFRESINEWAPIKLEQAALIKPTKRVLTKNLVKIGSLDKVERKVRTNVLENKGVKDERNNVSNYECSGLNEINTNSGNILNIGKEKEARSENEKKEEAKKRSKFVNKIKAIPGNNNEFLDCELDCVNDEEAKLEASLARLDLKYLRIKHGELQK